MLVEEGRSERCVVRGLEEEGGGKIKSISVEEKRLEKYSLIFKATHIFLGNNIGMDLNNFVVHKFDT